MLLTSPSLPRRWRLRFEAPEAARLGERGCTLADLLAEEGPMHPARFADLLDQAAAALDAAHALGVVHRDLTPSNLMLAEEPNGSMVVELSDFGVAEAAGEGSHAHVSPDGASEVGSRTDLWALGVLAYEALTGRDCFRDAATLERVGAIRAARFDRPSSVRRGLPRTLDAWFARAITLHPADRFPSAGAMARAFRAALASDAAPGAPLFAASVVVVLLAVAAAGLAVYRVRSASPRDPVEAMAAASVSVIAPAPTPSTAAVGSALPRAPKPAPTPSAAAVGSALPRATASVPAEAPSTRTDGTAHASDRSRAPTVHVSGGAAPAPAHQAPHEQVFQAPDKAPPEKVPPEKAVDPSEYQ